MRAVTNIPPSGATIDSPTFTGLRAGMDYPLAASAVAVSAPADTSEDTLATIAVPPNYLGPNGSLIIFTDWTYTNSVNNKTLRVKFGGTQFFGTVQTTTATLTHMLIISNRGATNSQYTSPNFTAVFGASTGAAVTGAIDTTVSQNILITGQKASAGETITLERYLVLVARP